MNVLKCISQSNNHMYLNTILKGKKAVLLLIPDDISIKEELTKIMYEIANFHNDKKNWKRVWDLCGRWRLCCSKYKYE